MVSLLNRCLMKIDEVAPLVGYLPEMQELHGTTVIHTMHQRVRRQSEFENRMSLTSTV